MAGDWIKVEKATPSKPEIMAIAAACNLSSDDAFGKCFRLWSWFDTHSVDGTVKGITVAGIDQLVGLAGFADALTSVGWFNVRTGAVELPNFGRHMGQTAKQRLRGAERQRKFREQSDGEQSQKRNGSSSRKRDVIPRPLRRYILERDGERCVYCGFQEGGFRPLGPYQFATLSIDHVIPHCQGGDVSKENLVSCCSVCNNSKNGRTPSEAGLVAMFVTEKCDKEVTAALPRPSPEKRREENKYKSPPNPPSGGTKTGVLTNLGEEDLSSVPRLVEFWESASKAGRVPRSEFGRQFVVACALKAIAIGKKPAAMFAALVDDARGPELVEVYMQEASVRLRNATGPPGGVAAGLAESLRQKGTESV